MTWSSNSKPVLLNEFIGSQPGPKVPISSDPLSMFNLYFTDNVIDLVVQETNRYAQQVLTEKGSDRVWSTNAEEVRAYFGFIILMGIVRLPEIRDYWSTNPLLHYAPIADKISRDHFEELTRYLHFVDNQTLPARGQPGFSRLQKVEPIINELRAKFSELYSPHCEISVDEAMVPFKGRSAMKQYIPLKPIKRGFKIWVLADSITGYFYNAIPYVGATTGRTGTGLGERVVTELTSSLHGMYHQVYCDNFFTGIPLFLTLLDSNTYACGTIRSNRKFFPQEILPDANKMKRGEFRFRQSDDLVAVVWKDKKPVTMLSTLSCPDDTVTVNRRQKDGTALVVECPSSIKMYNQYMGGVDKGDQLRGYYRVRLKSRKNYKYIFWFFFDTSITNIYILSKYSPSTTCSSKYNLKNFRLKLAEQLIGTYCSRKRAGRPPRSATLPPLRIPCLEHLPSRGEKSRRCKYCKSKRVPSRRRESVWVCKACPGNPHLCLTGVDDGSDCFKLWHLHQ